MRTILTALLLSLPAAALAQMPHAAPRTGSLFLSPMGEPFRSDAADADVVTPWFAQADADKDGALSLAELQRDADRFFAALDTSGDGEIDPAELNRYENEVAPEVQVSDQMRMRGWGARSSGAALGPPRGVGEFNASNRESTRWKRGPREFEDGLEGAGRFSFLNIPEPVIAADQDLNRGVSRAEFRSAAGQRLVRLDTNHDGRLTRAELPPLPQPRHRKGNKR
jgi:hypothetical protein